MPTPTHGLRVPDELWDRAAAKARSSGSTITDVLTALLRDYADARLGEDIASRLARLEVAARRMADAAADVMVPRQRVTNQPRQALRDAWVSYYLGDGEWPGFRVELDQLVPV